MTLEMHHIKQTSKMRYNYLFHIEFGNSTLILFKFTTKISCNKTLYSSNLELKRMFLRFFVENVLDLYNNCKY